jgi:hypothetical protein
MYMKFVRITQRAVLIMKRKRGRAQFVFERVACGEGERNAVGIFREILADRKGKVMEKG